MTEGTPELPRISDYAAWHASRRPDAIAMTLNGIATRYGELALRVDRLACALLASGVHKGDRVATLQSPHPDYLVSFLATASIGAIWVGLNPRYRLEELLRTLLDSAPVLLLTRTVIGDRRYETELEVIRAGVADLREVISFDNDPVVAGMSGMQEFLRRGEAVPQSALDAARNACGGRDPCLIVYTSGSSGSPKGALLHHEGIVAMSLAQNAIWPVEPHSIVNYFPINHLGCLVDCSTPCLIAGGTLHFLEQFGPAECLQLMARERVTIWGSVPSAFQMQLELENFRIYDLSAVQLIVWGGAAMPEALMEKLLRVCPRLATNYGMTETTSVITILEPTDQVEPLARSVGSALPGVELRLAHPEGASVAHGDAGEVQVRSRFNFLGYWNRPEATRSAFTDDGFFRTGDLAEARADGRYRLVGRLSDMYKSGGYNVYPREIEAVLESHPSVALAAVVSVEHPLWQEVGVAYLIVRAHISVAELEAHCNARLARYKLPKRYFIEGELPLLPIGKVDKGELRKRARREVLPES